jgi:catechol 2,3-dioxygenase-like lactoylglutathione lyase family enzyme
MIRGIHHLAISTQDIERAKTFYCDLLGFELVLDAGWPKGVKILDDLIGLEDSAAKMAMLKRGNAMLELFQFESPTPEPKDPDRPVHHHGLTHLCLDVTDLVTEHARLKAAGMRFNCDPLDLGGSVCVYGRDPDGNVIELQELKSDTSPLSLPL